MQLLIPVKEYTKKSDFYKIKSSAIITTTRTQDLTAINILKNQLTKLKIQTSVVFNAIIDCDIKIKRTEFQNLSSEKANERYNLNITAKGIEIIASSDSGAYYGIATLADMICVYGNKLPCCEITDYPDYSRRGVYLDVSRGKIPTIQTLKWLIEKLASWKINELQLYIENIFQFSRHPKIGQGSDPYSAQDILEIQDFCKLHHIRFVGSLASLGHLEKILMLPEYQNLAELKGFRGYPGGTTICPTDPNSFKFITELYEEFVPLFEADDFNFCGDEPWELGMGRSAEAVQKYGAGKVYLDFFTQIQNLCRKLDKRPNAWADIVLEHSDLINQVPEDTVLLNWEYEADGKRINQTEVLFKSMHDFMVCPGTSGWNTHGSRLDNAIANISNFADIGLKNHAEGLLNTDWGDNGHRNFIAVSLHSFAHSAAHSWNHKAVDDKGFTEDFALRITDSQNAKGFAQSIKALGNTYKLCDAPYNNHSPLFFTLIEPFDYKPVVDLFTQDIFFGISRIDAVSIEGCQNVIDSLNNIKWHKPASDMSEFDKLIFDEFQIAAQMDITAAKRAIAAKQFRAQKPIDNSLKKQVNDELNYITQTFQKLWLARNRKSQIQYNLDLFQKALII